MNNKNKELFNNDVEANVSEENIVLAPPVELFDEAKEIAQSTVTDEKFPFMLQYDSNQKEFLLSMLETVGAVVEDDDEEGHVLATRMNMTQLAFIKQLDCVERVKTDEGINPFLAEEAVKPTPIQQKQRGDAALDDEVQAIVTDIDPETLEMQTEIALNRTTDAELGSVEIAEANQTDSDIAVASVTATARSSCSGCPTNSDMAHAQDITVETLVSGYICCPGAEQWFKFVVPETKEYTIFTTGSLDTIGTLSGCCLSEPIFNDDCAGRVNFRIVETLCAGYDYYIKVCAKNDATGSYTLKVTAQSLAEEVLIHSSRTDGIIVLEQGKTYELPRGEGYPFLNVANTENAPLTVEVNPDSTTDKRVYWYSFSIPSDLIDTGFDWYDNTTKYQTITANSCGGTKLYAYDWLERGKRGEICVVVAPSISEFVKATNFKICKEGTTTEISELNMEIGEYQKVIAEVSPSTATVKNVNWVSTKPEVATITSYGRINAVSPGTTTMRAEAMDGSGIQATCTVTVLPTIKDNVEYHLLCNGDNERTLRVCTGDNFQLAAVPAVKSERKSYWKRQKWFLKSVGNSKKLFTQLNNNYYLCNNGSGEGHVSMSASDNNSNIVITPCANNSELYKIKLANSDLYLTLEYNSSDKCYWAKWRSQSTSNSSNQVWKFVEQPANLHNGVDTGSILNETTIQALKSENTEFVIRYYKLLDTLQGVELLTKGSTSYNGQSMSKIDATILKLQEKGINLDVENYLDYADTIPLNDNNLYITGNGKSLVTNEKNLYKKYNINIVSVYQNDGTQYEYFTEKHAKLDALSALMSAKILNQPHGTAIYFAVDYNASNNQLERIRNYFDIIKSKLGGRYQIGVYGSGLVCSSIKPNYAQYSWLGHSVVFYGYGEYDDTTKYNIKQAETYSCNGIAVDDDIAVDNNYGQW